MLLLVISYIGISFVRLQYCPVTTCISGLDGVRLCLSRVQNFRCCLVLGLTLILWASHYQYWLRCHKHCHYPHAIAVHT
jgi:hypothetical protein